MVLFYERERTANLQELKFLYKIIFSPKPYQHSFIQYTRMFSNVSKQN